VPWSELNNIDINFVNLSDGGFIDEITIPDNLISSYYEKMNIKKPINENKNETFNLNQQNELNESSIQTNKQQINLIDNNQYYENINEIFDTSRPPPSILQFSQQDHQHIHHIQQQQQQIALSQQQHQFLMAENEMQQQQHQQLLQNISLIHSQQNQPCFIRGPSPFPNHSNLQQTPPPGATNILNGHLMPILTQTQIQSHIKAQQQQQQQHQQRATLSHGIFNKMIIIKQTHIY
jgi:hypothetical protein